MERGNPMENPAGTYVRGTRLDERRSTSRAHVLAHVIFDYTIECRKGLENLRKGSEKRRCE
jgi:hypothetical protein